MHPNQQFHWNNHAEMLAFLDHQSFTTLFLTATESTWLVHAPVAVVGPDRVQFHVSRRNGAAVAPDGSRAAFSCLGRHAYISPDWYGTDDQVPTWNYVAVEGDGELRRIGDSELADLLDRLSASQESRLAPKPAWTRDKMSSGRFETMLSAICGFELTLTSLRGTRKLSQNKRVEERAGVIAALRASGELSMADLMAGSL